MPLISTAALQLALGNSSRGGMCTFEANAVVIGIRAGAFSDNSIAALPRARFHCSSQEVDATKRKL